MKPPFIRIVNPVLKGANVQDSGAILLDLLTLEDWKPCYTIKLHYSWFNFKFHSLLNLINTFYKLHKKTHYINKQFLT